MAAENLPRSRWLRAFVPKIGWHTSSRKSPLTGNLDCKFESQQNRVVCLLTKRLICCARIARNTWNGLFRQQYAQKKLLFLIVTIFRLLPIKARRAQIPMKF